MMFRHLASLAIVALAASGIAAPEAHAQTSPVRFPDARDDPPPGWTGHVFRLSQSYPLTLPPEEPYPWKAFDPKTLTNDYLRAVLQYALDGNVDADWEGENNKRRKWYHAPWLHWGRNGREFVRGLTHERVSMPGELATTQVDTFQNWAVGMYNDRGGYTVGQVWKDATAPNERAAIFPEGTVSIKLLFTSATVDQVPYLKGAKEWTAYVYSSVNIPTNPLARRSVATVRLLQIDVAVKDKRVSDTTGWVYGTFVYNGDLPGGSVWDKMVPVGGMWGNDPDLTVRAARQGRIVREGWINSARDVPFQHLGWAGRLNGPVDNPISSCLSCHSTAQWPAKAPLVPPRNVAYDSVEWMRWFRNINGENDTFSAGTVSLDYSLQLLSGMTNFFEWRAISTSQGGSTIPRQTTSPATGQIGVTRSGSSD